MASPESEVSRESEELSDSHPTSPQEQLAEVLSEEDEGTAADSPAAAPITVAKNGKDHAESDEEGEASDDGEIKDENGKAESGEEGELEDGEVDEDEDGEKKAKNQVCKYYYKGQCTWGAQCRFIHPGYVNKGDYNMFQGLQKPAAAAAAAPLVVDAAKQLQQPQSLQKVQIARDLQRPLRPRTPPSLLGMPPLGLARLPIIPPDFFPPIPEPPRRETNWERGVKQARHLAQAAAKKRDAMEDKMHGLADHFDPDFGSSSEPAAFPMRNGFIPEEAPFPSPFQMERRTFPVFPVRNPADFDQMSQMSQMTRERELRRHQNFMDQQAQLNFGRESAFPQRRRSPPANDLRKNLNDARNQQRNQRPADEWQDPWMRSGGRPNTTTTTRQTDRWVRKSVSPRGGSRSLKSRSRSGSKVSRTSRISDASEPRKRLSRRSSRSPKRQPANRAPSGSPISSTRSGSVDSRSPSPAPVPQRQQERSSPVSSRVSDDRGGRFSASGNSSRAGRQAKRKHEGSPISSASSRVDDNDDGPRTPPPDEEHDDDSGASRGSGDQQQQRQKRRQPSGSPISPEHSDDNMRRSASPAGPAFDEPRGGAKRQKKAHKPIKLTMHLKTDRRNALTALGPDGDDDDENVDSNGPARSETPSKLKQSSSVDLDRSSPLSDEESSQRNEGVTAPSNSSDTQNKREELLRQLRAVEEAIARKKATKTSD